MGRFIWRYYRARNIRIANSIVPKLAYKTTLKLAIFLAQTLFFIRKIYYLTFITAYDRLL